MKKFNSKFLSAFISAILILTSVIAVPMMTSATAGAESTTIQPIFDSSVLESNYVVGDTNVWIAKNNSYNTSVAKWGEILFASGAVASTGVYLPEYFASTKLLAQSGYAGDTSEITDFVWEFDYCPGNPNYADISFMFHVNSNSSLNTGTQKDREGVKNAMGISIFGVKKSGNWFSANTLRIDAPSTSSGAYTSADRYTDSSDSVKKTRAYVDLSRNLQKTEYSVRIVLKGNSLIASIWEKSNKAGTYRSVYYEYSDAEMALAPNGDFAITQHNTNCCIKNMKIYKGTDVLLSDEDYSEYEQLLAPTKYTFDTDTQGVDKTSGSTGTLVWDEEKGAISLAAGEDLFVNTTSFDSSNDNLGDFVLKYDFIAVDHIWLNDYMSFRSVTADNEYHLRFQKNGVSANTKRDVLLVEKVVDGTLSILAEVPLTRSITKGQKYTVKLDVQGNTIKVYFAQVGTVYSEPIVTVIDDTHTTGGMYYHHIRGTVVLDNIEIYDLTAKAVADEIEKLDLGAINCTMKDDCADLTSKIDALHAAQVEKIYKIDDFKNAFDHNHQVDAEASSTATYFVAGKEVRVCKYCNDTVETPLPVAEDALIKDECKVEFANGNLTITLAYSEALIEDIQKNGAVISFNYSIGEYSNSIEIPTGIAAEITLEGFNVDRLNAELTYYLTAECTGVNTNKLAGDTTNSLKVSEKIDANSEIGVLMNALKTEANTVVRAEDVAADTVYFTENTITADLKEGTMVLNFIASDELVAKLAENKAYTRTNKITVTIDGVANTKEFTREVMRKSTTINISGMSFEQLNGRVTIKVEFIYKDAPEKNISDTIVFEGSAAVAVTDTLVANAFEKYIAK